MSVIGDAVTGLKARLDTISDVDVYVSPPSAVARYPIIIIDPPEDVDYQQAGAGNDIEVSQVLVIEYDAGRAEDGWAGLYDLLDPSAEGSIVEAIRDDRTLGGNVDWARVEGLAAEPERDPANPALYRALMRVRWYKSVT